MIKLLYFASLVDVLGRASNNSTCHLTHMPAGLTEFLARRDDAWRQEFGAPGALRITVNKQFADLHTALKDGDEIAFVGALR